MDESKRLEGLSEEVASARLRQEGYNELPSARRWSIFALAWDIVREPMILLLLAAATIYFLLGDLREAMVLLFSVFVVIGISLYQNRKTERALAALRELSSPRALVRRSGRRRRIPGREVVRGDILLLSEGDRVPADATLLEAAGLSADESLLTGESVPVRKLAVWPGSPARGTPGGDDQPFVYSGTLLVSGGAVARADATGSRTEIGRIGQSLQTIVPEKTRLQRETGRLVRRVAVGAIFLCLALVVLHGLTRGNWLDGILAGLALAMAILPEEFPVVLTVFLALGAWRISRKNVLTRRLAAIESLGSATVLCVDKTGTLTQNRMSVSKLSSGPALYEIPVDDEPLPEDLRELVESGVLASRRDAFDPMERAIRDLGTRALARSGGIHDDWVPVREYPLSPRLLATTHVWRPPGQASGVVAAKGAPEAIATLCRLSPSESSRLLDRVGRLAGDGLRVLGVARATHEPSALPADPRGFDFRFVGLIALADPVRPTVPAAIRECHAAGIRIVMITGDYPATAASIARQIGLDDSREIRVLTGPELERMDEETLRRRVASVDVFARVVPQQKLRLVNALKANGEVVAMTGDGVNDAPALKAADMGIAMGERGTDVAREAADLVLLNDDFASIVESVRMGRRIFDNLRKAVAYILAIHVPIAGMSLLPVLFGWPLVLLPVHIVFLELIIDPACSLVFEAEGEEADIMRRPPRRPEEPLFSRRAVGIALLQGAGVLAVVFGVFALAVTRGQGAEDARALAFTTLIVANLALILTNRSWTRTIVDSLRSRNAALAWVVGGAVVFLALILRVPVLRGLFGFSSVHSDDLVICLAAGVLSILWFEAFKALQARSPAASSPRR
jgi:P-type Ca2+ transporter type 2C